MNTFIVAGELKSFLAVGWTLTIHRFPSVGFDKKERPVCRLDFNHPPISIGGIREEGIPAEVGKSFKRKTFSLLRSFLLKYHQLPPVLGFPFNYAPTFWNRTPVNMLSSFIPHPSSLHIAPPA
ncbi:MAG: hypothetical protein L0229_12050 [Blastocatellia bacterium]|nr:hypothetical protein [Blastocatellia bacterium]